MVEKTLQEFVVSIPFNSEVRAIDVLSEAFEMTVRKFGEDEAMVATISIFTSKAMQLKKFHRYAQILCMNVALLERFSDREH